MLSEFDLELPGSLEEALDALAEGGDGVAPLAGGTNLLVDLRARRASHDRLVGLSRISGLDGIGEANGTLRLGAGTTVSALIRSPLIAVEAPALAAAARVFGGAMVRNVATVAGNICYASPAADLVPPLMALDAEVSLRSMGTSRTLPLDGFFLGVRETRRRSDELLTEIRWPARPGSSADLFYKIGLRKGDAITVACVAVSLSAEAGACSRARIVLGAVAPVVLRAREAEAVLEGARLDPATIHQAAARAAAASQPIDDIRASAEYRRHLVEVLTRRLLSQAWAALS